MAVTEEPEAGPDRRYVAALVDHRQAQRLAAERARLADPGEEPLVGREAAERDVLAVVGRRRRVALALRQRLHRAAERRPRLVEHDLVPAVDQLERSRQAGEATADDRDLSKERPGDDPELRRQGELRLAVEDVIAARLDPLERRAVEAGERADAGGAAAVERSGAGPGRPPGRSRARAPW